MTNQPLSEKISDLEKLREQARQPGSERSVQRQHDRGKMLARERIEYFLDEGSFNELDMLARHRNPAIPDRPLTDGVITGWGTVDGRKVFVFSQDFTLFGGALGEVFADKIHKLMDLALKVGAPVVGLNDGAGARIQEGPVSLASYGGIFYRNVKASGVTPQISVILGPCAGGAVYSPAMTDFVFMVEETSYMFITGPDVVKTVTGEDVTQQELGGAHAHSAKSGVAAFTAPDDKAVLDDVRYLLSFLPANNMEEPPRAVVEDDPQRLCDELAGLMPDSSNQPYDMRQIIGEVVDDGDYVEYFPQWAQSITCGFARVDGHPVGIVGNNPMFLAGVLDIDSSEKAARFVRVCDAFNVPLVTFVDVPGFLPGVGQEHGGIIRHGAKLLYAYCEATVPRIQVITRKAYGGAYVVMNSKSIGADLAFAWPSAELAVMGATGAVEILHRTEIAEADDPDARKAELVEDYSEKWLNPYVAAERGYVDDVIDPAMTRRKLVEGLELLRTKREELPPRKHGNTPL
ncbi:acyl-CoA carboxylase subunit beta [Iamia majanohamensis]|uniref:Acyl-CoA carboxylase subunit beta n=1 Tax=Iamia majanohamensis TaxID=467976 RepID=A0AAE9Y7Z5_9ACTN|nr:acyl-CoA carboxylase subunit beta [Iamia majanohamensis]WCO67381.1 acyl-CoA carboxylase subunit beta [Iamia majanohamensis]